MRDLTKLSDTELHDKITSTLSRMDYFQSMGNSAAYQQIVNIYWDYMNEQQDRLVRNQLKKEGTIDEFGELIKVNK
jgi:hypothetical protein